MKRTVSARKSSSARGTSTRRRRTAPARRFVVCVRNDGYEASLERNKIYTALPDAAQAKPRTACADLMSLTGYEFTIVTTTIVPAAGDVPEHCRMIGQIQPEIRFEVSLPTLWNGHLYMFGNGGYAGESLDAAPRVGARSVLVLTGYGQGEWEYRRDTFPVAPDHVASDLLDAVEWALKERIA